MKVAASGICAAVSVLASAAFLDMGFGLMAIGCGFDVAVGVLLLVSAAWFAYMAHVFIEAACICMRVARAEGRNG